MLHVTFKIGKAFNQDDVSISLDLLLLIHTLYMDVLPWAPFYNMYKQGNQHSYTYLLGKLQGNGVLSIKLLSSQAFDWHIPRPLWSWMTAIGVLIPLLTGEKWEISEVELINNHHVMLDTTTVANLLWVMGSAKVITIRHQTSKAKC